MKSRRKIIFFWSLIPISFLFVVPLVACGNSQSVVDSDTLPPPVIPSPTPPPVIPSPTPPPVIPPINGIPFGTTSVGLDISPIGHSIPNPHYPDDKNDFILANGPAKTSNENNEPLIDAMTNTITNQFYSNMARRSYSFLLQNGDYPAYGTCWILDYQLPTDGTYPKKWYFGTNAHVLDDLKVKKDYNGYEKFNYGKIDRNTEYVQIAQLRDSSVGSYGDSNNWGYWKSAKVAIRNGGDNFNPTFVENSKAKTVFMGTDFLDSKPSDFNSDNMWNGMEEFADFAVVEIEFETETEARAITNDYVNWKENEKFHLPKTSLLNSPDKGKSENQFVLGFPTINSSQNYQVMINQPKTASTIVENGQRLANSPWYQTFDDTRNGMFDMAIASPWFNTRLNDGINEVSNNYKQWGLFYAIRHSNLLVGASGSMVMDSDYSSIGIQWGYDMSADYGFSQALISEGYDYNGKYGSYNSPAYDLINGNILGQKNSYKQSLKKIYGPGYKTHLFPLGL